MVTQQHEGLYHRAVWTLGPMFTKQAGILLIGNILLKWLNLFIYRSLGDIVVSTNTKPGG